LIHSGDIRDQSWKSLKIALNFGRFFALPNFVGGTPCNICPSYHPGYEPHPLVKFRDVTLITPKVVGAHMWNFKPNFKCSPLKFFGGHWTRFVVCASKTWSISSACKNFRGQHPQGPSYSLLKKVDMGGSKLTCPTFWIVDQSSPDFFRRMQEESLSITCLSDFRYLDSFRRYSRWKLEVV